MKTRAFGKTGLTVSEIGFGAWGIGGITPGGTSYGETDDATSRAALEKAFDLGVTFFDTSSVYGYGRSETLIGEVFKARRDKIIIASKGGFPDYENPPDYSPESLRASLEGSLTRLGTDYLDIYQLHSPDLGDPQTLAPAIGLLRDMQGEGKIRHWGLSVKAPADGLAALEAFDVPALQVNFNMMDVRALESGLFDRATEKGAAIVARTPLCFGYLTGGVKAESSFPPGDHRLIWPAEQRRAWAEGAATLFDTIYTTDGGPAIGETKVQTALRFCLSFDAVSCVIPGPLTAGEVAENTAAGDLGPLAPDQVARVLEMNRSRSFFVG